MTPRQKLRLRACRMLISYQKNGDFEFQSPRVERIFSGETGNLITQFIQHERAIGRSEKTIESREIYLRAFNLYLQRFDLSFNDLSVDCIEAFFKSMNYELAMRHNSANHLRQLFHHLYDRGITVTDNLPSTDRMCAGYRQLNAPKPASNGIEQKPPSLLAVRSCAEHRKTPGSHEPGVSLPPRGRNLLTAAEFYGVWVLRLTPRRAGGRYPPRPRWSAQSDKGGPSCPSDGSAPSAAPSPCRGGAGR